MNTHDMFALISSELDISSHQVKNTVELLDSDNTVPFISRYRKEVTGSLDEEQIRAIEDRMRYLRTLEERKQTVLKSIEEQGKLTPELEEKIKNASKLQEVEDLYLPYKPKRRTRATIAKEKGLEPLALLMMAQDVVEGDPKAIAAEYIDEEKGVASAEEALQGAQDIIAEMVSDDADIRKFIREWTVEKGLLHSETANETLAAANYEMYKEFHENVKTIPPYRILAINRGEKESALRAWIDPDHEACARMIKERLITNQKCIFKDDIESAIADGYQRLIMPAIQREVRKMLTDKADEHAIEVFARNLRALLLTPPLRDRMIMGIDPGFRTGCKVAVIDQTGKYLEGATIYPHAPQNKWESAKAEIAHLCTKYKVDVVSIGNGTASRETEKLVSETLKDVDGDVNFTIVNEAGASVYSASPVAKQEFPDLEASMRGNISIARRLLDPLSELVKIDPKSIGVGLYQHDVDQTHLSQALDQVVESCVNAVGVNLNTASSSLLKYVSGINSRVAENIIKYRETHGAFKSREEIKQVSGVGDNSFVQSAGFLRIPESDSFLDRTAVHPESYHAAESMLNYLKLTARDVQMDGTLIRKTLKSTKETLQTLAAQFGCGRETLEDIIDSLEKPNRDPRDEMPGVILKSDVLSIEDLREGMVLKGTVRNVVDFGVFVDIGVKHDGLVHLSKMAKRYVKNPLDIVSVGDIVDVKVMSIDSDRGRIGLSMILDD